MNFTLEKCESCPINFWIMEKNYINNELLTLASYYEDYGILNYLYKYINSIFLFYFINLGKNKINLF